MKTPNGGLSFTALVLISLVLIAWLNPKILTMPHIRPPKPPATAAATSSPRETTKPDPTPTASEEPAGDSGE